MIIILRRFLPAEKDSRHKGEREPPEIVKTYLDSPQRSILPSWKPSLHSSDSFSCGVGREEMFNLIRAPLEVPKTRSMLGVRHNKMLCRIRSSSGSTQPQIERFPAGATGFAFRGKSRDEAR